MNFQWNKGLILTILFLIGLGIVQVYSSSFIFAIESRGDGLFFVRKQVVYAFIGLLVLIVTMRTPWHYFEKYGVLIWGLSIVALVLTFIPSLSIKAGGAYRWLKMPLGQRIEPAEFVKYSFPFFMAFF